MRVDSSIAGLASVVFSFFFTGQIVADREAARNRKQRNRFSLIDFLMFPPCRPNFLNF